GPRAGGDLADGLAAQAHGGDRGGDLGRRRLPLEAGSEEGLGGFLVQRRAVGQLGQEGLEGVGPGRGGLGQTAARRLTPARSRKLPSSSWPCSVAIDSGWNCTPCTGRVRCWKPMISPSSVQAVISSSAGKSSRRTDRE